MWTENWNFIADDYKPNENDIKGSKYIQSIIYEFMLHGEITSWKTINDISNWPEEYQMNVMQPQLNSVKNNSIVLKNYKYNICTYYENIGLGKNFWWVN
jgi:hypothetical protein